MLLRDLLGQGKRLQLGFREERRDKGLLGLRETHSDIMVDENISVFRFISYQEISANI